MRNGVRATMVAGAVGLTTLTLVAGASATGGSTPPPAAAPGTSFIGTLDGPTRASKDGIKLKFRADTKVRNFTLNYPIGSNSGWHAHPGLVLAVVQQGTVKREIACEGEETFTVGEAFIEAETHRVTNVGTDAAILRITQLYPASFNDDPITNLRIDEPEPTCPPKHRHPHK